MKNPDHKHSNRYTCKGTCGANLTEEEYNKHPTKTCGGENCSEKGQPFSKVEFCEDCGHTCSHGHSCC